MIELRVVENELGMRTDIQYRYHIFTTDASGGLCPFGEWSEWKTAPYVKAEEIEND